MPFELRGRTIAGVGVVGSGHIGPDIALFFAKALAPWDVPVAVCDTSQAALDAGRASVERKLDREAEKKGKPGKATKLKAALSWTTDLTALAGCDLVVEAVSETLEVKQQVVQALAGQCRPGTVLLSNSSHIEPEVIFGPLDDHSACANAHFFFPADRNLVVEVIPGVGTDGWLTRWLMEFFEVLGKLPVEVRSRYGYAINPVYEGLLQLSVQIVEEGLATVPQVDAVACRVLGLKAGPFAVANLCGANPLAMEGLPVLADKVNSWFGVPELLRTQAESGEPWPVAGKDEAVEVPDTLVEDIGDRLLGAYLTLAGEILDSGVIGMGDLDVALGQALSITPPFTLFNKRGAEHALECIDRFIERAPEWTVPACMQAHAGGRFIVPVLARWREGNVSVVQIRRPAVLNALNSDVFSQLEEAFNDLKDDPKTTAVVLTGFGTRAFVAGADIRELATLLEADDPRQAAIDHCRFMQRGLLAVENLGKPVVAAMNGLALGGGSEVALACHARIGVKGVFPFVGQPEPNLGLIPGAGGTQRLPRLIGFDAAWPILRNGKPIDDATALETGYVSELVDGLPALRHRAVQFARDMAAGKVAPERTVAKDPVEPTDPPDLDIGHLSTAIDALLVKAVVDGAKQTLADGLETEFAAFGDCFRCKDARIGLDNFIANGPRAAATFEHA